MEDPMVQFLLSVAGWGIAIILILATFSSTFFTVKQQTSGVIQQFGRFVRVANAGLNAKIPFIEQVAGKITLRVQQLDVKVETKTKDNVFVHVMVSVQYFIDPAKVFEAFYKLREPEMQIKAFVFDVVRAHVPKINLDDVFEKKDEIADAVKKELASVMDDFGYSILKALVTDIDPDAKVKASMNEINAAQRLRAAATEKGEADKILVVKAAEAEAKSKELQGQGIASQRKAIIEGMKASVTDLQQAVKDVSAEHVLAIMLLTQYLDTLAHIGASSRSNTILIPHSPGALGDLLTQMLGVMKTAGFSPGIVQGDKP